MIMVLSCCAINCTTRFGKEGNMKFHRFPKNQHLRDKWVTAMRRKDYNPSEFAVLCGRHFLKTDYEKNINGIIILKKDAVPSVFNFSVLKTVVQRTPRRVFETTQIQGIRFSTPLEGSSVVEPQIILVDSSELNIITSGECMSRKR